MEKAKGIEMREHVRNDRERRSGECCRTAEKVENIQRKTFGQACNEGES